MRYTLRSSAQFYTVVNISPDWFWRIRKTTRELPRSEFLHAQVRGSRPRLLHQLYAPFLQSHIFVGRAGRWGWGWFGIWREWWGWFGGIWFRKWGWGGRRRTRVCAYGRKVFLYGAWDSNYGRDPFHRITRHVNCLLPSQSKINLFDTCIACNTNL